MRGFFPRRSNEPTGRLVHASVEHGSVVARAMFNGCVDLNLVRLLVTLE